MPKAGNLGALGSGGTFSGFGPEAFSAYEKKKWSSNAYTLERRRAKDAILALARAVEASLPDVLCNLEMGASDEAPSVANGRKVTAQWVFFTRPGADRACIEPLLEKTDLHAGASLFDISVQHRHACIVLRLDAEGLAIGLEIAGKAKVDRKNAVEKLSQAWAVAKLVELCRALPADATVAVGGERVVASLLLAEQVEQWRKELAEGDGALIAEVVLPRGDDIHRSTDLIASVARNVSAFMPVFQFLAWSRENDCVKVRVAMEKQVSGEREKIAHAFEAGARVTISSGLFAGRAGYVTEIDGKGKAKVMVGAVSFSVDVKDLRGA